MPVCSTCGTSYGSTVRICVRDGTPLLMGRTDNQYVGTLLDGKYRIESFISAGGMGSVYRAVHVMLDKTVAVKVIKNELVTSDEIVARFQREARAASALEHPNIVIVYDLGQTPDGTLYIAMEFIDGPSLKELIRKNGPLTPREAIDILRQVASALSAAHRKQVVHRDLKSDNLMLESDGDRRVVKLVDFGIAKTFDDSTQLTAAGYMLGTPHYMSPEQAAGKPVDHRADLYSLGVILYEMLTGELPFGDAALTSLLVRLATETPSPPSMRRPDRYVPPALDAVAMRCLEKDPERRFQSADEFAAALDHALIEIERSGPTPPPIAAAEKTLLVPAAAREVTRIETSAGQITQATMARDVTKPPTAPHPVATPPSASSVQTPASTPRPGISPASLFARIAVVVVILGIIVAGVVYGLRLRNNSQPSSTPAATTRGPDLATVREPANAAPTTATPAAVPTQPAPQATIPPAPVSTPIAPPAPIDDGRGRVAARNENAAKSQAASQPPRVPPRPSPAIDRTPPPVTPASQAAAPTPVPVPAAPAPAPAPAPPPAPVASVACQGLADICGVIRAEILRALQEGQVTDAEITVKVALVSERPSTQFGTPSTVRTVSVDLAGSSRGATITMPTPRVFGFDPLFGRTTLQENARQIAAAAADAVRAARK